MRFERGRQGATVLALPARPEPPSHLTKEEREVWYQTTEGLPQDWFRPETLYMLEQYCAAVVVLRATNAAIRGGRKSKFSMSELLNMQIRQTKIMMNLATKMRLTQQSTYDKRKSKRVKSAVVKPWETGESEEAED